MTAQYAGVFVRGKPFHPIVMLHCSVLDPFMSYEENEVLYIKSHLSIIYTSVNINFSYTQTGKH